MSQSSGQKLNAGLTLQSVNEVQKCSVQMQGVQMKSAQLYFDVEPLAFSIRLTKSPSFESLVA